MILDTSVLFTYFVRSEPHHKAVVGLLDSLSSEEGLVISPYVIAELDHLLATRAGVRASITVLRELSAGAWDIASISVRDLAVATKVIERYADQNVGATDASLVVLADRYNTHTIATLDRRHFEVLRALDGEPFDLVPSP